MHADQALSHSPKPFIEATDSKCDYHQHHLLLTIRPTSGQMQTCRLHGHRGLEWPAACRTPQHPARWRSSRCRPLGWLFRHPVLALPWGLVMLICWHTLSPCQPAALLLSCFESTHPHHPVLLNCSTACVHEVLGHAPALAGRQQTCVHIPALLVVVLLQARDQACHELCHRTCD